MGVTFVGILFFALAILAIIESSILLALYIQMSWETPYWAATFWFLALLGMQLPAMGSEYFFTFLSTIQMGQSFPLISIILIVTTFFNSAIANGVLDMKIYSYTFGTRFTVLYAAINTVIVFFYWSSGLQLTTYIAPLLSIIISIIILYYFPKLIKQEQY